MSIVRRHNVKVAGSAGTAMVFAHGFGCDQNMWRFVAPAFEDRYRTVLFDHIGAGGSDPAAFDAVRYAVLDGYADDVVAICRAVSVTGGVFVGHSVSAMIGILAYKKAPELFESLILICPSPRYLDDTDYVGGFSAAQVEELLDFLDDNQIGWSQAMAPAIMAHADRPELGEELTDSFCRMDPAIAKRFARTTFLSDNRADLADVQARCLVIQCAEDILAPAEVGAYMHRHLPNSTLAILDTTGHCPNLSAPKETIAAIEAFL
ncbi:alpha/beta fold hydrolase [Methylobacterium sp. Leaf118]|uniref:alpha/beta fold hydrolase n=1 Tax=Methylobacterium sp. Leaf118 TaxID=2876562 RepID=UPI001E33F5BA|nr:alpha/beta hydrolase [Methylobacterium sp. Leaf118]